MEARPDDKGPNERVLADGWPKVNEIRGIDEEWAVERDEDGGVKIFTWVSEKHKVGEAGSDPRFSSHS